MIQPATPGGSGTRQRPGERGVLLLEDADDMYALYTKSTKPRSVGRDEYVRLVQLLQTHLGRANESTGPAELFAAQDAFMKEAGVGFREMGLLVQSVAGSSFAWATDSPGPGDAAENAVITHEPPSPSLRVI